MPGSRSAPWPVVFTVRIWHRAWWKRPAAGAAIPGDRAAGVTGELESESQWQERTKRQAFQQRVQELEERSRRLEEENQALINLPGLPDAEQVEALQAQARISNSEVHFAKTFGAEALADLHRAMNQVAQSGHPDFPVVGSHAEL